MCFSMLLHLFAKLSLSLQKLLREKGFSGKRKKALKRHICIILHLILLLHSLTNICIPLKNFVFTYEIVACHCNNLMLKHSFSETCKRFGVGEERLFKCFCVHSQMFAFDENLRNVVVCAFVAVFFTSVTFDPSLSLSAGQSGRAANLVKRVCPSADDRRLSVCHHL